MIHQKEVRAVLLVTILAMSATLLGWSIVSTWRAAQVYSLTAADINAAGSENLPPRLESDEAKASLFYPVMKSRGPQPGGKLVAKPLAGFRGPEAEQQ